jgi:hypothetical protein
MEKYQALMGSFILTRHPDIMNETAIDTTIPPVLVLPPGKLYFGYPVVPLQKDIESKEPSSTFTGIGQTLRKKRNKK